MNDVDREEIHVPDVDGGQVPVGTHLHDVGDVDEVLTSFRSAHLGDVTLELSSFSFFLVFRCVAVSGFGGKRGLVGYRLGGQVRRIGR